MPIIATAGVIVNGVIHLVIIGEKCRKVGQKWVFGKLTKEVILWDQQSQVKFKLEILNWNWPEKESNETSIAENHLENRGHRNCSLDLPHSHLGTAYLFSPGHSLIVFFPHVAVLYKRGSQTSQTCHISVLAASSLSMVQFSSLEVTFPTWKKKTFPTKGAFSNWESISNQNKTKMG